MGKLFNLKEWLTVTDAARHLSIVVGEDVTEADVLHLARERKLQLSVRFVNGAAVQLAEVIRRSEVEGRVLGTWYVLEPDPTPKWITTPVDAQQWEQAKKTKARRAPLLLNHDDFVILLDECTSRVQGVFDLAMIGNERMEVERAYQDLTGGPDVILECFEGIFLTSPQGQLCRLLSIVDSELPIFNSEMTIRLPKDHRFVVRTAALREFEQSLNSAKAEPDGAVGNREHISDKLSKMNQGATKFWGNADRNDRSTHPSNAVVAAWFIRHDFSATLADKAATIIRPEWAPIGRKPEE